MTPIIKLNNGFRMPAIGFGTWKLQGEEAERAVGLALEAGYRHIDTADAYGNHGEVGAAIKAAGISREDIFLTSKVWRERLMRSDVLAEVDRFLEELQTDYLDLLLIHWPNKEVPIAETLDAMEKCRQAGKVKSIGVSNFTERHIEEALAVGVPIVNNQVEIHPSLNQKALREYCASKQIAVTAYSALSGGDMDLPEVTELSEKYNKSPAEVIINWVVSRGMIALPKSSHPERIKLNLHATEFTMEESDLATLDNVEQNGRYVDPVFSEFDYR